MTVLQEQPRVSMTDKLDLSAVFPLHSCPTFGVGISGIVLNYKISTAKEDSTSEGRYFKRAHHCCVISKLVLKRGKTEIGYRFPYRVSTTECLTTTFSQNSSSILAVDILLF